MANAKQGRGKAAYRQFKRDLAATTRDVKASFASGDGLSPADIQRIYDLVFTQYVREIEDAELPNPQIWINRGVIASEKSEDELLAKLRLERSNPFTMPTGEELEYEVEDEDTGVLTTKSIPIISGSDRLAKAGIVVRKRLIPPDEIEEYVAAVPYPIGIQPVYEDGILKGFRLWVQK